MRAHMERHALAAPEVVMAYALVEPKDRREPSLKVLLLDQEGMMLPEALDCLWGNDLGEDLQKVRPRVALLLRGHA